MKNYFSNVEKTPQKAICFLLKKKYSIQNLRIITYMTKTNKDIRLAYSYLKKNCKNPFSIKP